MREFFKPWRRKIGVVTLGLACVFMAGWIRSHLANDGCTFWFIKQLAIESMVDTFVVSIQYDVAPYGPIWATGKPFKVQLPHRGVNGGGGRNILEMSGFIVASNGQGASLFVP